MPRPRFTALEPARRRAILDAAAEEFSQLGFEGASYNRIIERAGVSKGAMYYYFDDKTDLFVTTVADAVERAEAAVGEVGAFSDPAGFWQEVRALYERVLAFLLAEPLCTGLLKSLLATRGVPGVERAVDTHLDRAFDAFAALLGRGVAVGAVRDDLPLDLLARLLFSMGDAADRWALERWESFEEGELERLYDRIFDVHLRAAAPAGWILAWEGRP